MSGVWSGLVWMFGEQDTKFIWNQGHLNVNSVMSKWHMPAKRFPNYVSLEWGFLTVCPWYMRFLNCGYQDSLLPALCMTYPWHTCTSKNEIMVKFVIIQINVENCFFHFLVQPQSSVSRKIDNTDGNYDWDVLFGYYK